MDGSTRSMRVYNAAAEETNIKNSLARRFDSLDGKVIGLLTNTKDRTEEIFDGMDARLKERFSGVDARHYRKESDCGASAVAHLGANSLYRSGLESELLLPMTAKSAF